MSSKKKKIIIIAVTFVLLVSVSWFSGLIPRQIAKIYGKSYVKNNFPEKQLEYVDIEWNKFYGDYIITFKGKDEKIYSSVIGPKFFPISMGQGVDGWE